MKTRKNRFNGFHRERKPLKRPPLKRWGNPQPKPGCQRNETKQLLTQANGIRNPLVAKMPYAREYHCHLSLVSDGDHFFVPNRAARLNSAGCASFGRGDEAVGEREKSVACDGAAF